MSGIKDVMVRMPRAERDRLYNTARRAEESEKQALQRERLKQKALDAANMKLETLNRTLNTEISGLHADMRNMANEQNRRFREQAADYNRRIHQQAADFNGKLERQKIELQNSINDVKQQSERNRQELQNQINGINARMEAKENNARKLAEFWISQTQAYIKDIEQYRHAMFTPNQLEKLKGKLNQMLSDMQNGMYEAAISTARGLFNDAVDLKDAVLNAETEWLYYHGLFLQTLADTEANLNYHNNLQFTFEMEHGKETVDAKVNYWTNGALDEISSSISDVKQKTERIEQVSTQQLIGYIDTLNQQNVKMETASDEAKEALLLSQNRAEMANKLADALAGLWDCERIVYKGGEQNQPVHVKLTDGTGNEIVAIITPEINDQNMANKLELNFFDRKFDERQRQEWIASIQDGLRQEGVEVGEAVCVGDTNGKPSPKKELLDIEATARRQVKKPETARRKTTGNS